MSSSDAGPRLRGRRTECETLDRLVAGVRAGQSQVLVLRGEPGIGKTALLNYLVNNSDGCRIARAVGIESEMELAFAGLHQLCSPMLHQLDHLPGPQRDALATTFGLDAGKPPDRFLVGLAVMSLMAQVAEEQPLVCLVDDAQWLDQASAHTLAFVSRRLLADRVAIVFAARTSTPEQVSLGLPVLTIQGLPEDDARQLLGVALHGPLDPVVRDQIVAESRGNPLALLELPRGLTAAEMAFGFGGPEAMPLANRIEEGFVRRLEPLPAPSRRLLLAAAVEPIGDMTLLWRAVERLTIGPDAAGPAEAAGLIEFGARVRFRHPLVRSAVFRAADLRDLREVHGALAAVTDGDRDPDRKAWHRAHAVEGTDEAVAEELERSAGRAQTRGGPAAAAAFLQEAARLTRSADLRARRTLAAAQAHHEAGAPDTALGLLARAQAGPLDELHNAKAGLLRAQIVFASRRGSDAPPLLLKAARQFEPLDIELARETYLDAFTAAVIVGRLSRGAAVAELAGAARAAPPSQTPVGAADLLLDGLVLLVTEGRVAGTPVLRQALEAFRDEQATTDEGLRWLWLAGRIADDLWDDDSWDMLCTRHVELARQVGALTVLPIALRSRIFVHAFAGELDKGAALMEEVGSVTAITGTELAAYGAVALAAWRGDEADTLALIESTMEDVLSRGEGMGVAIGHHSAALLYNGLGRYSEALVAAQQAGEYDDPGVWAWALTELIEAAARLGRREIGVAALHRLTESTRAGGTDWALGIEARSTALLAEDGSAEPQYREAIDRLRRTKVRAELARAHLVYGEWLRRNNRRLDAREQLRCAHEMFAAMGINAFAERARRELLATGETVRKRTVDTAEQLTAQEAQIARLAAEGLTNPEIGARLFISSRTVEWHLRKVFSKIGVASRRELRREMPAGSRIPTRASV